MCSADAFKTYAYYKISVFQVSFPNIFLHVNNKLVEQGRWSRTIRFPRKQLHSIPLLLLSFSCAGNLVTSLRLTTEGVWIGAVTAYTSSQVRSVQHDDTREIISSHMLPTLSKLQDKSLHDQKKEVLASQKSNCASLKQCRRYYFGESHGNNCAHYIYI